MKEARRQRRLVAITIVLGTVVLASACSSGGTSPTTTASGVAVLGTRYSVWVDGHGTNSVDGQSGFGKAVKVAGRSVPQFTDVHQLHGRVVSLHMALPSGTSLGKAESLVRAQLPADVSQTASWQGSFAAFAVPVSHCEFVDYQSADLARSLGSAVPSGSTANIGTSFYERTKNHPSSSIVSVNSADISTKPAVLGQHC